MLFSGLLFSFDMGVLNEELKYFAECFVHKCVHCEQIKFLCLMSSCCPACNPFNKADYPANKIMMDYIISNLHFRLSLGLSNRVR